ncbi:hypothetical protein HGM15179_012084 [Zosterops borbonicus]|uniref:Uncharacterized protein n=1 Tax=Zosterops borbonicus TaxID=364589 RepID=A0A8K1LIM9_9PASS|nr:hypothetical protein HGM15179_012084 [Zosterops borbonicus]
MERSKEILKVNSWMHRSSDQQGFNICDPKDLFEDEGMVGRDKFHLIHTSKTAVQIMKIFCGIDNQLAKSLCISESEERIVTVYIMDETIMES